MKRNDIALQNIQRLTKAQFNTEVKFLAIVIKKIGNDKELTTQEFNKLHSLVTPNGLLYNEPFNEPRKMFGAEQIPASEERSIQRKVDNYLLNNTEEWKKWKKK